MPKFSIRFVLLKAFSGVKICRGFDGLIHTKKPSLSAVTSTVCTNPAALRLPFRVTFVATQMLTLPTLSGTTYTTCSKPSPIIVSREGYDGRVWMKSKMPPQSDSLIVEVEIWDLCLPVAHMYVQWLICMCVTGRLQTLDDTPARNAQASWPRKLWWQQISRIEAILPFIPTVWDDVWMKYGLSLDQKKLHGSYQILYQQKIAIPRSSMVGVNNFMPWLIM